MVEVCCHVDMEIMHKEPWLIPGRIRRNCRSDTAEDSRGGKWSCKNKYTTNNNGCKGLRTYNELSCVLGTNEQSAGASFKKFQKQTTAASPQPFESRASSFHTFPVHT
ncbi:unnamed protein product [Ectocarpus sp. 12 AP-2014]